MTGTGHVAPVDQTVYRDAIGRFASGVTVITTATGDRDFGTTASAVSSLSMEPPMLLICLNRTSETGEAIAGSGVFGVNILSERQTDLAYAFAQKAPDKFKGMAIHRNDTGVPLIPDALAHIECRVAETATGGTHTVFMGEVIAATARDEAPLTYYRGRFGRFRDTVQDDAYQRIRGLIVSRELPRDEPLDAARLSRELEIDESLVFYALTKLSGEGLVARDDDGRFIVRAFTVQIAHDSIDARATIEVGVVARLAGQISDVDLDLLGDLAETAHQAANADPVDMALLGRVGRRFHDHFVGLLDNETLSAFLHRLDMQAIWWRVAPDLENVGRINADYLGELVAACRAGDRDAAVAILLAHSQAVKNYARQAIDHAGGAL
jgi:flavin reductase (DIM6/NTAB) family NADH-FMN oxidoreductase RutF/DNA-binding GntR family transcriptional regulator